MATLLASVVVTDFHGMGDMAERLAGEAKGTWAGRGILVERPDALIIHDSGEVGFLVVSGLWQGRRSLTRRRSRRLYPCS